MMFYLPPCSAAPHLTTPATLIYVQSISVQWHKKQEREWQRLKKDALDWYSRVWCDPFISQFCVLKIVSAIRQTKPRLFSADKIKRRWRRSVFSPWALSWSSSSPCWPQQHSTSETFNVKTKKLWRKQDIKVQSPTGDIGDTNIIA